MQAEPKAVFDHVVLTGFMGSGKTTVGRLLAKALGWDFADLDEVVASGEALSVPQILDQRGEATFRQLEARYLAGLLLQSRRVIALGGGAPESEALRLALRSSARTAVFHLQGDFHALYQRCSLQSLDPTAVRRPLLGSSQAALTRYTKRKTVYAAVATHTVDACQGSAEEVAAAIVRELQPVTLKTIQDS